MAIKPRAKSTAKPASKITADPNTKADFANAKAIICFRTRELTKKKAEKIFSDLGISMSSALNIFLTQVVRDKGLPFTPTTQKKGVKPETPTAELAALEDIWEEL